MLLDLLRSATIQTLVFLSVWSVVHHTEWSPECLTCLVPLSAALSFESLRSNSPPEDPRKHGGRAGLKIDVAFLMLNRSYVVNSCKKYFHFCIECICIEQFVLYNV